MLIIGVDPGVSGAIAAWDGSTLRVFDTPTLEIKKNGKNRNVIDLHELARLVKDLQPVDKVYMELVGAMPGQAGMFTFGDAFGVVRGIFAAYFTPIEYVSPMRWKRRMAVLGGKDGSLAKAKQLLPAYAGLFARKKDDGRAEATLLALYGASAMSEMQVRNEPTEDIFG